MLYRRLSHRKAVGGGVGDGNAVAYPAVAYLFALKCKISEKPYPCASCAQASALYFPRLGPFEGIMIFELGDTD